MNELSEAELQEIDKKAKICTDRLKPKQPKIELKFMVVPEMLANLAYVPNAVRVKIIDPEAIFLLGILGESGRKLVENGVEFYFEGGLAKKLIDKGIAKEVFVCPSCGPTDLNPYKTGYHCYHCEMPLK